MPLSGDEELLLTKIEYKISDLYLNDSISLFNETTYLDFNEAEFEKISIEFYDKLKESVMRRVQNLPRLCKMCAQIKPDLKFTGEPCTHAKLAVLFSGGVDSTVLAALADLCLPEDQPIDLLNIAFEKQKKQTNLECEKLDDFMVLIERTYLFICYFYDPVTPGVSWVLLF